MIRRPVFRSVAACGLALACVSLPSAAYGQTGTGDWLMSPLPARPIAPLRLLFFQLTPETARPLGRGESALSIDISESNILHTQNEFATEFDADINLEISRVNVRFRHGISERTDLGIELPVYRYHSGFLDGYIRGVEDFLGDLKVQRVFERETPGAGLFRFQLLHDGEVFFELPGPRSGPGDLAVTVKRSVRRQSGRRPDVSLRAAIKLPTGDDELGMGGDVDLAVGIAAGYQQRRWAFHGTLQTTFPFGDPYAAVGLNTPPILSGHAGASRHISPTWVFHFQLAGTSGPFERARGRDPSPLPPEPFEDLGGSILDATFGVSHMLGRRSELRIALAEDLQNTANAAADVTLLTSLTFRGR